MQIQKRPRCAICNKAYGQRRAIANEHVAHPAPPYAGPLMVLRVHGPYGTVGGGLEINRYLWDGKTFYLGTWAPFCSVTCGQKGHKLLIDIAREYVTNFVTGSPLSLEAARLIQRIPT